MAALAAAVIACQTAPSVSTSSRTDGAKVSAQDAGAGVPTAYHVGGTVTGLHGAGLILQNNVGDDVAIAADGAFGFAQTAPSGSAFSVTVKAQPSAPAQSCVVSGGAGTVASGDVSSITVNCETDTFALAGKTTGLAGAGLVLVDNNGHSVAVNANGTFAFPKPFKDGTFYGVHVQAQPTLPSQTCIVDHEQGTFAGAPVTTLGVTCTTNRFAIGGTVSGLAGTGLVLQNNAGDDFAVAHDGTFTFATPVKSGEPFAVTVKTQPSGPVQECQVSGDSATVLGGAVTSVAVLCKTTEFSLSGTVAGLAGTGLVLTNNGADDRTVNAASFSFAHGLQSGAQWNVAVKTQPTSPWQTCAVDLGKDEGTMTSAGASTSVTCATNTYDVGGGITNLLGSGLVIANGTTTAAPASGATSYKVPQVASMATYAIGVQSQPTSPWQTCAVASAATASSSVAGAAVTNADIVCTTNSYGISGMVTASGGDVVLTDGTADVTVTYGGDGKFSFPAVTSGQPYTITVKTPPGGQACTVTNGSATMAGGPVSNIGVECLTKSVFLLTGAQEDFTVPVGVTSLGLDVRGAAGGASSDSSVPGYGGRVETTLAVTPGQVLHLFVGGAGVATNAGFNGGGAGVLLYSTRWGGAGGGASDIRIGGTALSDRVVVAGGGGGAGSCANTGLDSGGVGGGLGGGQGTACYSNPTAAGTGATQSTGGTGGQYSGYNRAADGAFGIGGNGATGTTGTGGGGGWYGGGGGSWSGAGGGSAFVGAGTTSTTQTSGFNAGHGKIIITW